jgi:integral membrane protein
MPRAVLGWFRFVAFVEGISYLVLVGIAMPLKYVWHWPEAVRATGMAHGVLFIAYSALVAALFFRREWTFSRSAWAMFLSFLPLGTFLLEAQLRSAARRQQAT